MRIRSQLLLSLVLSLVLALLIPAGAFAQHDHAAGSKSVCAESGFGNTHHPVKTTSPEAQRMFDQGLALDYGFNHNEAEKCFQQCAGERLVRHDDLVCSQSTGRQCGDASL